MEKNIILITQWVTSSLVLLLKRLISKIHQSYCYINYILNFFYFQCDFDLDFQITTSKMIWILILIHLYLGDLILILKSSTYDDFARLCLYRGHCLGFNPLFQFTFPVHTVHFSISTRVFD